MHTLQKTISLISLVVTLSGCANSLKDDLIKKIDKKCGDQVKSNCEIALKDVTKFKWDKMYLFGSWTASDSITRIIGFSYDDDVPDDNTRMLFI